MNLAKQFAKRFGIPTIIATACIFFRDSPYFYFLDDYVADINLFWNALIAASFVIFALFQIHSEQQLKQEVAELKTKIEESRTDILKSTIGPGFPIITAANNGMTGQSLLTITNPFREPIFDTTIRINRVPRGQEPVTPNDIMDLGDLDIGTLTPGLGRVIGDFPGSEKFLYTFLIQTRSGLVSQTLEFVRAGTWRRNDQSGPTWSFKSKISNIESGTIYVGDPFAYLTEILNEHQKTA